MLLEMYCVRPLLKQRSEEAEPKHPLGVGQMSNICAPSSTGFLGWGVRLENPIMCCWMSQWRLGKHKADAAASAVTLGPSSQLHKSAFLHRGEGLNDPRWGKVFTGWMVSAWMCGYPAFGMGMYVYVSTHIQIKVYIKGENSPKIWA